MLSLTPSIYHIDRRDLFLLWCFSAKFIYHLRLSNGDTCVLHHLILFHSRIWDLLSFFWFCALKASGRRRRKNSGAQSRLSEVVLDDSRQHVLDYVLLFSWCDSNATWQCQQHCFLQQKEWWLVICIFDLESWSGAACLLYTRASSLHAEKSLWWRRCTQNIAHKNTFCWISHLQHTSTAPTILS